ncbi:MAG: hypothetical protein ABI091_20955 [Ferruginibacter sp.]
MKPDILSFFSSGPVIRYCSGTSPAQTLTGAATSTGAIISAA